MTSNNHTGRAPCFVAMAAEHRRLHERRVRRPATNDPLRSLNGVVHAAADGGIVVIGGVAVPATDESGIAQGRAGLASSHGCTRSDGPVEGSATDNRTVATGNVAVAAQCCRIRFRARVLSSAPNNDSLPPTAVVTPAADERVAAVCVRVVTDTESETVSWCASGG